MINEAPLVSVIIPAYNSEKYIAGAVRSVLAQSYENIELIIVDDGSEDGTTGVLSGILSGGAYTLISLPHSGQSAARNAGVNAAHGKWIYFLDSDDLITPDAIEKLVSAGEAHSADIAFSDISRVRSSPGDVPPPAGSAEISPVSPDELIRGYFRRAYAVTAIGSLLKRSFLLEAHIGFKALPWCEDIFFIWDMLAELSSAVKVNAPLYIYVDRPGSLMNGTDADRIIETYKKVKYYEFSEKLDKTLTRFIIPRFVWSSMNTMAKRAPFREWKRAADAMEYRENFRALLKHPDPAIRLMSAFGRVFPRAYYVVIRMAKLLRKK